MLIRTAVSLIICLTPLCLMAQLSGSGEIMNYNVGCPDGNFCEMKTNPTDTFIITIAEDGNYLVNVMLTDNIVTCCGSDHPQLIRANLLFINTSAVLASFTTATNGDPYIIKCAEANDQFRLVFSGKKGDYEYFVNHQALIYDGDPEENDTYDVATVASEDTPNQGHIGYGAYDFDRRDWYRIESNELGPLRVTMNYHDDLRAFLFNEERTASLDVLNATGSGIEELIAPCADSGDVFFLRIDRDSPKCTDYSFFYYNQPLQVIGDNEPNNTLSMADTIKNLPGSFTGDAGYGYGSDRDVADYFYIGKLESNDVFQLKLGYDAPFTFKLLTEPEVIPPITYFNNAADTLDHAFLISTEGHYYLAAIPNSNLTCAQYLVEIGGDLSHQRIEGISDPSPESSTSLTLKDVRIKDKSTNIVANKIDALPLVEINNTTAIWNQEPPLRAEIVKFGGLLSNLPIIVNHKKYFSPEVKGGSAEDVVSYTWVVIDPDNMSTEEIKEDDSDFCFTPTKVGDHQILLTVELADGTKAEANLNIEANQPEFFPCKPTSYDISENSTPSFKYNANGELKSIEYNNEDQRKTIFHRQNNSQVGYHITSVTTSSVPDNNIITHDDFDQEGRIVFSESLDMFTGEPIENNALEYEGDLLTNQFNTDVESGITTKISYSYSEPFEIGGQSLFRRIELTKEVDGNVTGSEVRLFNNSSARINGFYGGQLSSQNSRGEENLPKALRSGFSQKNHLIWHLEITDQNDIKTTNDTYIYTMNSWGCAEEIMQTDMNGVETTIPITLEEVVIPN